MNPFKQNGQNLLSARHLMVVLFGLLATACRPGGTYSELDTSTNSNIRLSLRHDHPPTAEEKELLFSALRATNVLGICLIRNANDTCVDSTQGFEAAKPIWANSTRKFFQLNRSILLEDGLIIRVVAMDRAGGTVIDQRDIQFQWTGSGAPPRGPGAPGGSSGSPVPGNPSGLAGPTSTPSGSAGTVGSSVPQNIRTIVQNSCGGGACHPNYAGDPSLLKSKAAATIQLMQTNDPARVMPRGRTMSQADKGALISYLSQ
jgi:hypothetical protein